MDIRTDWLGQMSKDFDMYMQAQNNVRGDLSEAEYLELFRLINQILRRNTRYGGVNAGNVSEALQRDNRGDVRTDEHKKS